MTAVDFRPSEVFIDPTFPLVATMGRAEIEHAAACLVRACQAFGDSWRALPGTAVADVIEEDARKGRPPFGGRGGFASNPYFDPDVPGLVGAGYARRIDDVEPLAYEFTPKGLEALRRHVRRPAVTP